MADDGPLFIVDNSPGGRSGLDYLREWCELATTFDIATGFFDIGALLSLDGHWQELEGIRILMGDEISRSTRRALLDAVTSRAYAHLDESIETEKRDDPFLEGADAVVAALAAGKIACKVYNRDKFHAKAYITHGKFDVLGSQALVGSSNFTRAGLTQNVELNIKIESSSEVDQLQRWYEQHWADAVDVTPEVLKTVERHTAEYSPFQVYASSLRALVADQVPSDLVWDQEISKMYPKLDRYQAEAYSALTDIASQQGGALLCDGVGLGKTFVGLMLLERLILREGKRVLLLAPKAVREAVWEPELARHLAHVGGFGGGSDFSNLTVFNHTDLSRGGDYVERFRRIATLADAVVIDEAHHFRNRGRKPVEDDPATWSRYHRLAEVIRGGDRPKQVFMLTATPINNSLNDFGHLVQLFTQEDDQHFLHTLGVPSVQARLNELTRRATAQLGPDSDVSDAPDVLQETIAEDALFRGLVVQRSRVYARQSQILEKGEATAFPDRGDPQVVAYALRKGHGLLLDLLDESFKRERPLFSLAIYYPLAFYKGPDAAIDPVEENRQRQVVGLIRTNFLKRFESSVFAFERSCDRLMRRLLAFLEKNATSTSDQRLYERWLLQHEDLLNFVAFRQLELLGDEPVEEDEQSDDLIPPELLDAFEQLDPEEYDVPAICAECILDLDQIAKLLDTSRDFSAKDDDKLRAIVKLASENVAAGRKLLVFTEFADTARYLGRQLALAGIDRVEQIDGSREVNRAEIIRRFAPYYNGSSSPELAAAKRAEIDVLVATDVLAEGLNLQDATRLANYDIHWNPVRLMQRIGRVDRRLNPAVEKQLAADHPELAEDRGKVAIYNFLPPDELDALLGLYERVSFKTLLISKTLGIEGRKFLRPEDDYEALREFNASYEGTTSAIESLHLEYQQLLAEHPGLDLQLAGLPGGIFSGKSVEQPGTFLCFQLPALDTDAGEFTLAAGSSRWYAISADGDISESVGDIASLVRSGPDTERLVTADRSALLAAKCAVEKHINDTYLRSLDAPLDAPPPRLVAWMELVSG
jgi:superfamily II DNA or RNA helicase